MARLMAIDYGTKRCGIAVTDPLQIIASGLTTVATAELIPFLEDYFKKEQVELVLVGEPTQKDGTPSGVEVYIQEFLTAFKAAFKTIKVGRYDERYTSKMAFQTMIDSGIGKKKRQNKALVDQISATLILQDYLQYKT